MPAKKPLEQRMAELQAQMDTLKVRESIGVKLNAIRLNCKKRNLDQLTAVLAHLNLVKTDEEAAAPAAA